MVTANYCLKFPPFFFEEYFRSAKCPVKNELIVTVNKLRNDKDTDVKSQFSDLDSNTEVTLTNENTSGNFDVDGDEDEDETEDDEVDENKLQTNLNKSSQLKIVNFESEELENDQCY